jgi:maleate cis-trans isomerase
MVLGHANEQELIRNWEATYETRIFTSGTSHIDALRALNVRRFLGATYFCGDITPQTARDRNAAATARPRRRGDRVNICCGA